MGSSHSQVPYLSSDLREWLATTVEAHADEILQEWLGEAEEILREGNWQPLHVFRSRLEAEGRFALRALAARLRSNLNGPQTALERASIRLLAGNVPEGAERDSKLTTAFSLYYSFSDCLVRAVALHLPDYVSGKEALILRAALLIALRRVVDIAPCRFVARVEERLRGQQRQLAQVYKRLLMAQEDERRRIARDVHDVLAQGLAAARYRTETAARLLRAGHVDAAEGELQEVAQLIDYTLQHVRDIIFDLRPATLDRFGLRTALDDYAARIRGEAGPQITVRGSGDPKVLSEEQQLGLFRIAQEALWNAVRHSGASRAEVVLDVYDNETRLVVRDNGRGFDVDAVLSQENPRHYGLLGMRERAELIGGRFEVHSEIGRG
ncbi:MAG: sensor histidine kinase, partial [Armatimonadetes bacterium]|nr:sensor histidine kinase [Armatimonadota bacterium]